MFLRDRRNPGCYLAIRTKMPAPWAPVDLQGLASAISCKQPLEQDLPRPNQEKENWEPQASGNPRMDPSWGSIVVASGDVTLWESITPVSTWSTGGSQEAIPPYDQCSNHQVANPRLEHSQPDNFGVWPPN